MVGKNARTNTIMIAAHTPTSNNTISKADPSILIVVLLLSVVPPLGIKPRSSPYERGVMCHYTIRAKNVKT